MADKSGIEWTDATWNPIVGCSIVSPGCTNCYAMRMAARIETMNFGIRPSHQAASHYAGTTKKVNGAAVWTGKLALAPDHILSAPLSWKQPRMIFVNSMGDLFHEDTPEEWIDQVFAIMAMAPNHTFQLLTKRADRMRDYCMSNPLNRIINASLDFGGTPAIIGRTGFPLPNVWLGVSTERQQEADKRIPVLLETPAWVRFISAEPLLGPIDLSFYLERYRHARMGGALDWVIVGGESGPDSRAMDPTWAQSLRDQCLAANVPFFFKQWGEWLPLNQQAADLKLHRTYVATSFGSQSAFFALRTGKKAAGRFLDGCQYNGMPNA